MRAAALRLESFLPGQTAAVVAAMATDQAYQRGHGQGLKEGRDLSLDTLSQSLAELRQGVAALQGHDTAQRHKILAEITPVLGLIIDLLANRSEVERLRDALGQELARLMRHGPDQALVIRCPAGLRPEVEACLAVAGHPKIRLEDQSPHQAMVELICDQGRTLFDPGCIADALKAIIADIQTED